MYVIAPGDGVLALDATNGDLIWEHWGEHTPAQTARSKSLDIYQDMIYHTAFDGFIRALDAQTGTVRWQTNVVEDGSRNSAGGILVADGKVISNRSCNRFNAQVQEATGRRGCFITAHDAITGALVWKFYSTAAPDEAGGDTWGNLSTEERVASPWGLPSSYDPSRKVTLGHRQSRPLYATDPPRCPGRHFEHCAVQSLQQLDCCAERRHRRTRLVLPGAARRRLGR